MGEVVELRKAPDEFRFPAEPERAEKTARLTGYASVPCQECGLQTMRRDGNGLGCGVCGSRQ